MKINGTNKSDLIIHSTSDFATIRGGLGGDTLTAEHGNGATMFGGRGADTLNGGPGLSIMWGGEGRDRFVFDDAISSRIYNAIGDFTSGKDKIVLDTDVFGDIRAHDWFGTIIEQDGRALTYNGEVFVILRGGAKVDDSDFIFIS